MTPPTTGPWSAQLVRELFVVLYGGHQDHAGIWHPDLHEVARRRRVSQRTVQRWIRDVDGVAGIPAKQLDAILARWRPRRRTVHREELAQAQTVKKIERSGLGRGRGNLREYGDQGWLEQHLVLVIEDNDRPLRRIAVVRDDAAIRRRAARGGHIVDVVIASSKFTGDAMRHQILQAVQPWRLELTGRKVPRGHTQVWLASAPLPPTPLQAG